MASIEAAGHPHLALASDRPSINVTNESLGIYCKTRSLQYFLLVSCDLACRAHQCSEDGLLYVSPLSLFSTAQLRCVILGTTVSIFRLSGVLP